MITSSIKKLYLLFSKKEKKNFFLLMVLSVFVGILQVIGVGSIMPFISVASKPEVIHSNEILSRVYLFLNFNNDTSFIIFLGCGFIVLLVGTNLFLALYNYVKIRFTSMRKHSLSMRMLKGYLSLNYDFYLNRNSHEFVKNIQSELKQITSGTITNLIELISKSIQIILLTSFLFVVDLKSTIIIVASIGLIYGLLLFFTKKKMHKLGTERFNLNAENARILSETFWGIKEVKITNSEGVFIDAYNKPSRAYAINQAVIEVMSTAPKFILETVAFTCIMIIILITIASSGSFMDIAGKISMFAYAGYRMIPGVQGFFRAITRLRYTAKTVDNIASEFALFNESNFKKYYIKDALKFKDELQIRDLVFKYPNTEKPVLQGLNLNIKENQLVGFVGKTGSGKTTLIDIILGLLSPTSGDMLIDKEIITENNVRKWQKNIGYVPQNIYLSDDTIKRNIAFGIPHDEVDDEKVINAAKMAQIHEFIETELNQKYDTKIGERGIRLSGGQRQRIGIARALYRNPSLLIMDEATSALDNHTEKAVMAAIDNLQGSRTIILIAHRLSTLEKCDNIFLMEHGRIVDQGTYEVLKEKSKFFK